MSFYLKETSFVENVGIGRSSYQAVLLVPTSALVGDNIRVEVWHPGTYRELAFGLIAFSVILVYLSIVRICTLQEHISHMIREHKSKIYL